MTARYALRPGPGLLGFRFRNSPLRAQERERDAKLSSGTQAAAGSGPGEANTPTATGRNSGDDPNEANNGGFSVSETNAEHELVDGPAEVPSAHPAQLSRAAAQGRPIRPPRRVETRGTTQTRQTIAVSAFLKPKLSTSSSMARPRFRLLTLPSWWMGYPCHEQNALAQK